MDTKDEARAVALTAYRLGNLKPLRRLYKKGTPIRIPWLQGGHPFLSPRYFNEREGTAYRNMEAVYLDGVLGKLIIREGEDPPVLVEVTVRRELSEHGSVYGTTQGVDPRLIYFLNEEERPQEGVMTKIRRYLGVL